MTSKPATSEGYCSQQLERVHSTCLYLATKLGDLLDEIVVVGGLVPYLLVDQEELPMGLDPHVGTMDLGPIGAAKFIAHGPDDNIQADVVGQAQALLRLLNDS